MKIVVISDSHSNIANLKYVLGFAKKIKAKAIIHCGDWDNLKVVDEVLSSDIPLYAVLGNADVDERIANRLQRLGENFRKDYLEFELGGRRIGVIHDFNHLVSSIEYLSILFCGHQHRQMVKMADRVKVISPGALHSIKPSFVVYDTETNGIEFFDL